MSATETDRSDIFSEKYLGMMPFETVAITSKNQGGALVKTHIAPPEKDRHHVYVVITDDDKYQFYVGITGRSPDARWKEHLGYGKYSGAEYLEDKTIRAFVLVAKNVKNAESIEDKVTLQLMVKYGTRNVTGGRYAVDRRPGKDLPSFYDQDEYDYLADVDVIDSEPIPKSEAHRSVVNGISGKIFYVLGTIFITIPSYGLLVFIYGFVALLVLGFLYMIFYLIYLFIMGLLPF